MNNIATEEAMLIGFAVGVVLMTVVAVCVWEC